MRPPMGGGAHIASPSHPGSGGMGILMPIYTVAIVVFFLYTIMKVNMRKAYRFPPELYMKNNLRRCRLRSKTNRKSRRRTIPTTGNSSTLRTTAPECRADCCQTCPSRTTPSSCSRRPSISKCSAGMPPPPLPLRLII